MATQTTYYNFNKPSGTDLVNPLTDTNPNWDIADAALHELNERSVANCTEVVSLGVHALSTLNTDTKFLKWIATANYTAGETFTLNGIAVAAATPSGASLATNAYVSGAVVMACLNADNSAMTVFLSGTTVASDSERLGGELPSYYATDSDMGNAQTDITNIQNTLGNTSIVGIGDGTVTGAIEAINSALPNDWALKGSETGSTAINLPTSFKELHIVVSNTYAPNSEGYIFDVIKEDVPSSGYFQVANGFGYGSSNNYCQVRITSTTIYLQANWVNGTDITSSTTIKLYYR